MTRSNQPKPWREAVRLKDELRSGELALAEFTADLHEVTLGQGRRAVYEEPGKFFVLTYPTHALRELVKDVAGRLAGRSDKAVRQLLGKPQEQGLATLVLVDEVLMYAREKVGIDPVWRDRIRDFFQYLTQAVAKVERAAMVASLLATDPAKQRGEAGRELIAGLDETTAQERSAAEERYGKSFPFHPDLPGARGPGPPTAGGRRGERVAFPRPRHPPRGRLGTGPRRPGPTACRRGVQRPQDFLVGFHGQSPLSRLSA